MECDVIPTSPQEVDPLGNVENCNVLDDDGVLSLNATLITNSDDVNAVSKSRKIVNIATAKSRKMLTIRSIASPPSSHTATVSGSSLSYGIVSVKRKLNEICFFISVNFEYTKY